MWLFCVEQTVGSTSLAVLAFISFILCIIIIFYASVKTFTNKSFTTIFKIIYYLNNICWICSVTGYTLSTILPLTPPCIDALGPISQLGFWGYGIGFSTLYLLFIIRLNKLFNLTKHVQVFLYIGVIIMLIFHSCTGYFYTVLLWEYAYITGTTWVALNFFYCIVLVIVFLWKTIRLYKRIEIQSRQSHSDILQIAMEKIHSGKTVSSVASSITTGNSTTSATTCTNTDITITKDIKDIKECQETNHDEAIMLGNIWLESMKYIICVCIAVISTTCVDFMSIYRGFIAVQDTPELIHIHLALNAYDSFINVLCLNLQFGYFDCIYYKLCCPINRLVVLCVDKNK
eukprot:445661_1